MPVYDNSLLIQNSWVYQGDSLGPVTRETRQVLNADLKKRLVTDVRVGHREDLLICTILDPRFKLMNWSGCTEEMKADAEKFLRENYKMDWSPVAVAKQKLLLAAEDPAPEEAEAESNKMVEERRHARELLQKKGQPKVALMAGKRKRDVGGIASFMDTFLAEDDDDDEVEAEEVVPGEYEEVERYLRLPQIKLVDDVGNDQDILQWWKNHADKLPHLAKMARQFLALPASSAGPERLFRGAGLMHDDMRKQIKEGTLEMQLRVRVNCPL